MAGADQGMSLLCRVESRLCALPLAHVDETMRPLPIEPVLGTPPFVLGLSVIRGNPVPVVDARGLFGGSDPHPKRFVIVKAGERRVGLAVDEIVGIRDVDPRVLDYLPPLARSADSDIIASIGMLDEELLVVLTAIRIVPAELFELLESKGVPS
jgi:purine-binding chemotaxis protein CheW